METKVRKLRIIRKKTLVIISGAIAGTGAKAHGMMYIFRNYVHDCAFSLNKRHYGIGWAVVGTARLPVWKRKIKEQTQELIG